MRVFFDIAAFSLAVLTAGDSTAAVDSGPHATAYTVRRAPATVASARGEASSPTPPCPSVPCFPRPQVNSADCPAPTAAACQSPLTTSSMAVARAPTPARGKGTSWGISAAGDGPTRPTEPHTHSAPARPSRASVCHCPQDTRVTITGAEPPRLAPATSCVMGNTTRRGEVAESLPMSPSPSLPPSASPQVHSSPPTSPAPLAPPALPRPISPPPPAFPAPPLPALASVPALVTSHDSVTNATVAAVCHTPQDTRSTRRPAKSPSTRRGESSEARVPWPRAWKAPSPHVKHAPSESHTAAAWNEPHDTIDTRRLSSEPLILIGIQATVSTPPALPLPPTPPPPRPSTPGLPLPPSPHTKQRPAPALSLVLSSSPPAEQPPLPPSTSSRGAAVSATV
mmetsp:Transcript_35608/g.88981  ORF Transcript_35608/g.88981 Transcript_35608/m.88981 type:complete len:396 (-) Transcript_35608:130-1317(-)